MLKKILIGLAVVLIAFVAFVATRPGTYRVERSATIAAPADVIQSQVADFHKWPTWSPWEKLDPAMQHSYEGAESGVGAKTGWVSKVDEAGEGKMTVTELKPGERIAIDLEFIKPFPSQNKIEFLTKTVEGGTATTWAMSGDANFMMKLMSLAMSMDEMMGKDFEAGLANLKTVAEAEAKRQAEAAAAAAAAAAVPAEGAPSAPTAATGNP